MSAGIPWSDVNLKTLEAAPPAWTSSSSLSEVTSLTLEYFTLGAAMGMPLLHTAYCLSSETMVTVTSRQQRQWIQQSEVSCGSLLGTDYMLQGLQLVVRLTGLHRAFKSAKLVFFCGCLCAS